MDPDEAAGSAPLGDQVGVRVQVTTMYVAVCHRHKRREVRLESAAGERRASELALPAAEGVVPVASMYFHCPSCGVDVRVELGTRDV